MSWDALYTESYTYLAARSQYVCQLYISRLFLHSIGACRPCDSLNTAEMLLVIFITTIFFGIIGLSIIMFRDKHLDWFIIGIVSFQQIISVGRAASSYFSTDVARVYNFLKIFCFDYEVSA